MKSLKKLISILLIASVLFSLCACAKPTEPEKQEEKTDPGSVIRTGLILTGGAAAVSIVGVITALLFRKKRRG